MYKQNKKKTNKLGCHNIVKYICFSLQMILVYTLLYVIKQCLHIKCFYVYIYICILTTACKTDIQEIETNILICFMFCKSSRL